MTRQIAMLQSSSRGKHNNFRIERHFAEVDLGREAFVGAHTVRQSFDGRSGVLCEVVRGAFAGGAVLMEESV